MANVLALERRLFAFGGAAKRRHATTSPREVPPPSRRRQHDGRHRLRLDRRAARAPRSLETAARRTISRGGAHPKSILCRASKDDETPTRPALPRRGFLGTTAAAAFAALPWVKDIAAVAAGEPPAYPDVITMQESFWAKSTKAAHPDVGTHTGGRFPLGPGSKATAMNTVVPDEIWTFDQLQGLLDVYVNVRMTVIALEGGGLWVHNPVAHRRAHGHAGSHRGQARPREAHRRRLRRHRAQDLQRSLQQEVSLRRRLASRRTGPSLWMCRSIRTCPTTPGLPEDTPGGHRERRGIGALG